MRLLVLLAGLSLLACGPPPGLPKGPPPEYDLGDAPDASPPPPSAPADAGAD